MACRTVGSATVFDDSGTGVASIDAAGSRGETSIDVLVGGLTLRRRSDDSPPPCRPTQASAPLPTSSNVNVARANVRPRHRVTPYWAACFAAVRRATRDTIIASVGDSSPLSRNNVATTVLVAHAPQPARCAVSARRSRSDRPCERARASRSSGHGRSGAVTADPPRSRQARCSLRCAPARPASPAAGGSVSSRGGDRPTRRSRRC